MKKITAIIPCFNEEASIKSVIEAFPLKLLKKHGYRLEVLVIDNNSSDGTTAVATAAGARVIQELAQGKGNAMRTGFYNISDDTDFVVMLDGDDTYSASEITRLVEPLNSGFCNVVIGSRLGGRIPAGAMKGFNFLGNWSFSHLVRYVYQVNVTDVLTGYFAWTRNAIVDLRPHLKSDGFAIEMEMITKMARMGQEIFSVPISYNPRAGQSSLRPIYDGSRILKMFVSNLRWRPAVSEAAVAPVAARGKLHPSFEFGERIEKGSRVDAS